MTVAVSQPITAVRGARAANGSLVDVAIDGGRITAVVPADPASQDPQAAGTPVEIAGDGTVSAGGLLLLPAFAEPHAHLDKTGTIDAIPNPAGDLASAIHAWLAARESITASSYHQRAASGARAAAIHGVTVLRTHVDTGAAVELVALEQLHELAGALRDVLHLQLVPSVGLPITGIAGADNRARLNAAMAIGATAIGGAPSLDPDPAAAVDWLAEQADHHGLPLDLHVDETLDPDVFVLPQIAEAARQLAVAVTAGHCVSLAVQPPATQRAVAEALAIAGVTIVTLPLTNLYLQGRDDTVAPRRGLTAVRQLLDAGVVVAAGSDNVGDPFNPIGNGDPLATAALLVAAAHLTPAEALTAVTTAARQATLGVGHRIAAGEPADLVLVGAADVRAAIAAAPAERLVIAGGRLVALTTTAHRWAGDLSPLAAAG